VFFFGLTVLIFSSLCSLRLVPIHYVREFEHSFESFKWMSLNSFRCLFLKGSSFLTNLFPTSRTLAPSTHLLFPGHSLFSATFSLTPSVAPFHGLVVPPLLHPSLLASLGPTRLLIKLVRFHFPVPLYVVSWIPGISPLATSRPIFSTSQLG